MRIFQGFDMADTVADFFWKRLAEWGVKTIFGYPGDGINGLLGAMQRNDLPFEFIQVRHEEMAAFMAAAYAKFTGEVGVCMATSGPGATHLLTGCTTRTWTTCRCSPSPASRRATSTARITSRSSTSRASSRTSPPTCSRRPRPRRSVTSSTAPCASPRPNGRFRPSSAERPAGRPLRGAGAQARQHLSVSVIPPPRSCRSTPTCAEPPTC